MSLFPDCTGCNSRVEIIRLRSENDCLRKRLGQQKSNYDLICRITALEQEIKSLKTSTSLAQPAEKESQITVKGVYIVCN